jgi:hypothetical protein
MGQLRRYIKFSRTIEPVLSAECQPLLVDCYRRLRQGDAVGHNRTAYRITVRQLEALIRLSEALARMHLDTLVRPQYIEWAFRLLRTSIVQVDTADIAFSDLADTSVAANGGSGGGSADALVVSVWTLSCPADIADARVGYILVTYSCRIICWRFTLPFAVGKTTHAIRKLQHRRDYVYTPVQYAYVRSSAISMNN